MFNHHDHWFYTLQKGDDDTVAKTEKMAKDYRKAVAPATIPILKQVILYNHKKVQKLGHLNYFVWKKSDLAC